MEGPPNPERNLVEVGLGGFPQKWCKLLACWIEKVWNQQLDVEQHPPATPVPMSKTQSTLTKQQRSLWTRVLLLRVYCRKGLQSCYRAARSPSSALLPFLEEGSPTKIDYRKKGTLILTSLLEHLDRLQPDRHRRQAEDFLAPAFRSPLWRLRQSSYPPVPPGGAEQGSPAWFETKGNQKQTKDNQRSKKPKETKGKPTQIPQGYKREAKGKPKQCQDAGCYELEVSTQRRLISPQREPASIITMYNQLLQMNKQAQ